MLQSAKLRIISERQETRMNKTALQRFEERNEKACCLNCEKLIVKHTKRCRNQLLRVQICKKGVSR